MNRAARTLGLVTELAAIGVAGLLELAFPDTERDRRIDAEAELAEFEAEHEIFPGAAGSLADEINSPGVLLRPSVSEGKQEPVSGDACCNASDPHETSQPSPDSSPAGDRSAEAGKLPPTASAEHPAWLGWAVPAILDVLADHRPVVTVSGSVWCVHDEVRNMGQLGEDMLCIDQADWREHVAPLIAERIACDPAKAIAALQNFQPK